MSELVFAFGSNMCSGRFRDYGVEPIGSGRAAALNGFRLVFNKLSKKDSSGKANLSPAAGHQVWGVLYEISSAHLAVLDSGEGRGYRRSRSPVHTTESGLVDAWVYVATKPSTDATLRPYTWYKRFLVEGAQKHMLPAEYIAELQAIDATTDSDLKRHAERWALACT
jgi:hypothetical protein